MDTKKNKTLRYLKKNTLMKYFVSMGLAFTVSLTPSYAQQIVPDGYTNTNLNINGSTTSVTTSTIKGANAFNSFSKFDVYQGNTVNLVVPGQSSNLINIIKSQATNIDGTLNSLKNNQIGGNVFLVNPHGIFIGKQGVVNVGSLTAITPTRAFTDNFFDSPGNPNTNAVNVLLNGKAPVNPESNINVAGQIKAIEKVKIDTGTLTNSGMIQIADIVNVANVKNASNAEIIIQTAKDVINTGSIIADGLNNQNAGKIDIDAANNIQLATNSLISAKGVGANSNGGNINILAQNNTLFDTGAIVDVSGGNISGNGGFVELSANKLVQLGGEFKASAVNGKGGSILVDPPTLDIKTNQFSNGADLTFQADNTLTVADGIIISSRKVNNPTKVNHATAPSTGNSGDVSLSSNNIKLGNDSKIYAHADNDYTGGNVNLTGTGENAKIQLGGLVFTSGTLDYTSDGSISNVAYTSITNNTGGTINLTAKDGAIGGADKYIVVNVFDPASGSINATATGDVYLKSEKDMRIGTIISSGPSDVYLTTKSGKIIDALNGKGTNVTARDLYVQLFDDTKNYYFIGIGGDAKADKNVGLMPYYFSMLKKYGKNWDKVPAENIKIFEETTKAFKDTDVYKALTDFANKLKPNDVLLIIYNGHGYGGDPNPQFGEDGGYTGQDDDPVDEAVPGSKALNGADEGWSFNDVDLSDDKFADTLKGSKGTVVVITDACYSGGMFGGTADLDQVAQKNGFSYFGMMGNVEGKLGWASEYNKNGQKFDNFGDIHTALLGTISEKNPVFTTMDADAKSIDDTHDVKLGNAINANGNVYLNEWYNSIIKEKSYYSADKKKDGSGTYYTFHYPYTFPNFTNMSSTQLVNNPILTKAYDGGKMIAADSIGTSALPLTVNLSGGLEAGANNNIYISGNVNGTTNVVSNKGEVNLKGTFKGSLKVTANNDVDVRQTAGTLTIDKVAANNSDAVVISKGNIIDAALNNTANVIANNIYLQSADGTIGTANDTFDVTTTGGGLIALSNGVINIKGYTGDLKIDVISNSGKGPVIIKSAGSILNAHGGITPNIYAKDINLDASAKGATIGVVNNPLNIYSNYFTTGGKVTANANGYINLYQTKGNLNVNTISNAGRADINIVSEGSILDGSDDNVPNINGNDIFLNAKGGSIGTFDNPFDIATSANGKLKAFAVGYIDVTEKTGILNLDVVSNAGNADVKLTADSSIINGATDGKPNIYGKSINLTSTKGSIGTLEKSVFIYANYNTTGGKLTALADDMVNIFQYSGNLYVNTAESTNSILFLGSAASILDGNPQDVANILGNNILLNATKTGSLGLMNDPLDIDTKGGSITAQGYGYINLNQTAGDMNVNLITNAGRSDINLVSKNGSILNDNTERSTCLYGHTITLQALNGTIGTANNALTLDSNYNSIDGLVTALAKGYINLKENFGALNLNAVSNAGRSDVKLTAVGNIVDGMGSGNPNIYAKNITLLSTSGSLGNTTTPLKVYQNFNTTGGSLVAKSNLGSINIAQNTGNLSVSDVQAYGNIKLLSAGDMFNARNDSKANVNGADISLTSLMGALGTTDDPHNVHTTTATVETWAKTWVYVNKI